MAAEEAPTVYFWGADSPFSNFYVRDFEMQIEFSGGVSQRFVFPSSEHAFMYCKATFFKDHAAALQVLRATTPKQAKGIGRRVKGFDEERWTSVRWNIMYACLLAKFSKCPEAWAAMKANGDAAYAEASPYDRIWGIGYRARDAERHRESWGLNLLGKILGAIYRQRIVDPTATVTLAMHNL